jgi:hypothetical protein
VNLNNIYEIEKTTLDLFEAAGFHDVESLAGCEVETLHAELNRANSMHKIADNEPSRATIERWIDMARDLVGVSEEAMVMPINREPSLEFESRLSTAPFALPLPTHLLMERRLSVAEIPPLLDHCFIDNEVKIEEDLPRPPQARRIAVSEYVRIAENGKNSQRVEIDNSKMRSTKDAGQPKRKPGGNKSFAVDERVALICGPREETNKGRQPGSRKYIRGVLHTRPFSVILAALVTLLMFVALPCSISAGTLLLLSTESPGYFGWVPSWFLAVPMTLPIFGLFYLIWGVNGKCRVCGQKLFVHRSHIKNPKAHRIRGLGYILPLCIHVLVFRWFRCTHCGTSIRLKE